MAIKLAVGETSFKHLKPRITVIGVGGGGSNAINNMMDKKLEGVDFVVANTDAQSLEQSLATRKIQLGLEITQGLGSGARPEVGKMAAEEARADIERELADSNMVFITAGMGGGTGSGAAPVVAKIAKEKGILTVGVVTKPFTFEGPKRMETADNALNNFIEEVDSIIVIPNQNLFRIADKNTTLQEAFSKADDVLYDGVRSITDLMIMPGLINLDFADVKNIMEDKGKAIMGTGQAEGPDRAQVAAQQALSNPILDDCILKGAKGVLINITGGSDITLMEIDEAVNIIRQEVDDNANIIFGSSYAENLSGSIRVSVVVTGIDESQTSSYIRNRKTNTFVNLDEQETTPYIAKVETTKEEEYTPSFDTNYISEEISATKEESNVINLNEIDTTDNDIEEIKPIINEVVANESTAINSTGLLNLHNDEEEKQQPSSSLFNAIINKPIDEDNQQADIELASISEAKVFTPTTKVQVINDEPELFPIHGQVENSYDRKAREEAQVSIKDDNEPTRQRFIDKILGVSKTKEKKASNITPTSVPRFDELESYTDSSSEDDLEIPSFLRRR